MIGKHHKYTAIFCIEALKNLQVLDELLPRLKQGHDPEVINGVFRATHTLKGNAFGMGFSDIALLSDTLERFFDVVKKQKTAISAEAFEILNSSTNQLRTMVQSIRDPAVKAGSYATVNGQLVAVTAKLKQQTGQENQNREVEPRPFDPEPLTRNNKDWISFEKESSPPVEEDTHAGAEKISFVYFVRKLQDVVQFTAQAVEKEAYLEFEGVDVFIDQSILSVVDRVLLQLLRNAVAHGIEYPSERIAAGKKNPGKVSLVVSMMDDVVVIEVRDDGSGLDFKKIKRVAIAQGLMSAEMAATVSEEELSHFIFEPGFSTADTVSFVAGRGTGMDIVKTEVNSIGGSITVTSIPGIGTSFFLMLPAAYNAQSRDS